MSRPQAYMQTYTAGEDASRLKEAARELGLQKARQPRKQVRTRFTSLTWSDLLLHQGTEDARIRSIYTPKHPGEEGDGGLFPDENFFVSQEWEELEEADDENVLLAAILGIIKGMVGPAILYLPHGFATAGYAAALPTMLACTAMFLFSSQCLLDSWKHVRHQQQLKAEVSTLLRPSRRTPLSYPELAYRALGKRGERLVQTGIALMQSGVCLTYLIFVPQNLHTSLTNMGFQWSSTTLWLVLMVGMQIPLSWLRDIRKLTPTNLLANALILYGLLVCLGYAVKETLTTVSSEGSWNLNRNETTRQDNVISHARSMDAVIPGWYLFVGTSVLLFEGSITLLVPLQESVHTPAQQKKFPTVYRTVILCIIVFYAFFGMTNWMAFGSNVRTVLTTSLPDTTLSTTVQLAYSVAVLFTFPLQNFPALEITCRSLQRAFPKQTWLKRNLISSITVTLLACVAVAAMDSLDKVVSLMGSLLGCPIAFIFPPLIHSKLIGPRLANHVVVVLGMCATVIASVITIITW